MDKKYKVAILTSSISRSAGGLYYSVRSLAKNVQSDFSCDVGVFTLIDNYFDIDKSEWNPLTVYGSKVFGPKIFGFSPGILLDVLKYKPEIIHQHGIWMFPSVASNLVGLATSTPVIISPRGMLDKWAVKNSSWKKKIATFLFERSNFKNAACFHALNESEAESIRQYGIKKPICVIPNAVDLPSIEENERPEWMEAFGYDKKYMLFLGRLHPKKGLGNLLSAWELALKSHDRSKDWILVIAGWGEKCYEEELRKIVDSKGLSSRIIFVGPLYGKEKISCLSHIHGFILPSLSEGLPMALLEAWAFSVPVLNTLECNVSIGFELGASIRIGHDIEGIYTGLMLFFGLPPHQLNEMGKRGRKIVENFFNWTEVSKDMKSVYDWLLNKRDLPNCVRLK